jgi:hypothetical protein
LGPCNRPAGDWPVLTLARVQPRRHPATPRTRRSAFQTAASSARGVSHGISGGKSSRVIV